MRREPAIPWIAALLATAACSTPPPAFDATPLDRLHTGPKLELPRALEIEPLEAVPDAIAVGDCAVYSLTIRTPDGEESWFVRTAIAAHQPSLRGSATYTFEKYDAETIEFELEGVVRFHLEVLDATGETIGESLTKPLPAEVLASGFAPLCEFSARHRDVSDRERYDVMRALPPLEQRALLISTFAVDTMVELVLGAEPLAPLLERAIRKPNLLTIALNFTKGVGVLFKNEGTRAWSGATPPHAESAFVMPIEVKAFGERALVASMVVVDRASVAPATVGVTSIAAMHPDDAGVEVQMRLQAIGRLLPLERARIVTKALADG